MLCSFHRLSDVEHQPSTTEQDELSEHIFFSKPICQPFLLSKITAVVLSASFDSSHLQGLPAPILVTGPYHIKTF